MRLALSTGGGDAPGLNAVIRAVVLSAHQRGWQTYGIERGFDGLLRPHVAGIIKLDPDRVRGITHLGGTILGTTNRGNPFRWREVGPDGAEREGDRSDDLIAAFNASGFEALITIGGDGSLKIGYDLWKKGLPVVGVPKTIDNDVMGTVVTFGFDTAVSTATEAIDKLHSTAESHERVMVVELMGREAGWIALNSGIAGSADVILIPEIPFEIEKVCEKIREREARGRKFSISSNGAASGRWTDSAGSPRWSRRRSRNARGRRPGPSCWGTSSAAGHRRPSTGSWHSASAPPRCARWRRSPGDRWSPCSRPTSP